MRSTRSSGRIEVIQTTFQPQQELVRAPKISIPKPEKKIKKIQQPRDKADLIKKKQEKADVQKKDRQRKAKQMNFQQLQGKKAVKSKEKQQSQKEEIERMLNRLDKIRLLKKAQQQNMPAEKDTTKTDTHSNNLKNSENSVLVDLHYGKPQEVKVYIDSKNFPFSVTFNQSDVAKNINKFYIMQILQSLSNTDQYYVFTRWGRVGQVGNKAEAGPLSLQQALDNYRGKIQEKIEHGYKKIETSYENQRRNFYFPKRQKRNTPQVQSKLQPKVQNLIRLIFDMKMINNQLKEIGYDSKKMPLGKIAQSSIIKGYQALKQIMEELKKAKPQKEALTDWSSKFFSHIPHDFGMKNLANYVLDSQKKVKAKLEILQSIQDIQIYTKLIDETIENPDVNELDANYEKLNYHIKTLAKDTPIYQKIIKCVENTHAPTHNHYKLQVDTIYELTQKGQSAFKAEYGNRCLLWHGSRLTNIVGILNKGLRIAPPEAPATGYMFGKGVYFADIVSKSANYCHSTKLNPIGCLILCEVALGNCSEKFYADYYANLLTEEYHSVKGVGKTAPKDGERIGQNCEVYVPNGVLHATGISNTSLQYNEYVVYDVNQIRCRYLLKVKFVFK